MPKFLVHGFYTKKWEKVVEAESREEAQEKAWNSWEDEDVWDTDEDIDVEELKE
jgi:hypothetical protein